MSDPKRKPWICAENGCFVCEGKGICDVPENCAFTILHALSLLELGLQERPRRWGKTHALAELAAMMIRVGCRVTVVFPDENIREHASRIFARVAGSCRQGKNQLLLNDGICWLETKKNFLGHARGIDRMLVLTDELKPEEVEELKKANEKHDFVLGYYTQE